MRLAIRISLITLLLAVSSAAKAFMDAINFRAGEAFTSFPVWFQDWAFSRGEFPILKIDDGWHAFQAVMFLTLGVAFHLAGSTSETLLPPQVRRWRLVIGFAGAWLLRLLMQGAVFETLYKAL